MQGKTVVITGATSGIGEVAALELAKMGARVVFTARNAMKGSDMLGRLRAANPAASPALVVGDLSLIAGMKSDRCRHRAGSAVDRCPDQQRRRLLRETRGHGRWPGEDLRAQPHGLFRRHRGAADREPRPGRQDREHRIHRPHHGSS